MFDVIRCTLLVVCRCLLLIVAGCSPLSLCVVPCLLYVVVVVLG